MALAHAQPALAYPVGPAAPGPCLMIRLSGAVALCAAGGWLFYGREATETTARPPWLCSWRPSYPASQVLPSRLWPVP